MRHYLFFVSRLKSDSEMLLTSGGNPGKIRLTVNAKMNVVVVAEMVLNLNR